MINQSKIFNLLSSGVLSSVISKLVRLLNVLIMKGGGDELRDRSEYPAESGLLFPFGELFSVSRCDNFLNSIIDILFAIGLPFLVSLFL